MKAKKSKERKILPNAEPYYLYDFWILSQREDLSAEFHNRNLDANKKYIEIFARDSSFTMKLHHSPLFQAQIIWELTNHWENWRDIRRDIRKYALKYQEFYQLSIKHDYVPDLRQMIINNANLQASNFMTWGIVMFDTPLQFNVKNIDHLINLYGAAREQGKLNLVLPILSVIIEKFTQKSTDFMAFASPFADDFLSDFLMFYKIRYCLERCDPSIMSWLFSERGIDKDVNPLNEFIRVMFSILFTSELEQIAENLEDLANVEISKLQIEEINELTDIILHSFWHSLSIKKQWELLNQWPSYQYMYEFGTMIFLKFGDKEKEFLQHLLKVMNIFGYMIESWDFLTKMWNDCIKINQINLLDELKCIPS